MSQRGDPFNVSNLSRGLDILELLQEHPAGLGITDIQARLKLSKNLVFRITGALHGRGYLVRHEDSKRFILSRRLMTMGYRVANEEDVIEIALPLLRSLRDAVEETVVLCGILETDGVVLDAVPGLHAFRFTVDTGMTFPIHASAPGKAMLAVMPESTREHLIGRLTFERLTATTITTRPALRKELDEVRAAGFACDRSEGFEGVHCVAAAVINAKGLPIAAVNITGPAIRFTAAAFPAMGRQAADCAALISARLGHGS